MQDINVLMAPCSTSFQYLLGFIHLIICWESDTKFNYLIPFDSDIENLEGEFFLLRILNPQFFSLGPTLGPFPKTQKLKYQKYEKSFCPKTKKQKIIKISSSANCRDPKVAWKLQKWSNWQKKSDFIRIP